MSKRTFALNRFGYVTKWLVSGPLETPVDPATRTIVDQGQYERYLKETIHNDDVTEVPSPITLGAPGIAGKPWRFYRSRMPRGCRRRRDRSHQGRRHHQH